MVVLKFAAGLAALLFVLIALFAVVGGVLGFVQRARRGPSRRHEGLSQPPKRDEPADKN